jgi:ferritin
MGDKVYKPIIKDGDHIIHSKENPERVRGLTRDENNQNPNIIEWEELDTDDLQANNYSSFLYEEQYTQLVSKDDEVINEIAEGLAEIIVNGAILVGKKFILPWWKGLAWPLIKEKFSNIRYIFSNGNAHDNTSLVKTNAEKQVTSSKQFVDISSKIDKEFEQFTFEMSEEEAKIHMMRLIYYMLGIANEIRIISNTRIKENCNSIELCTEQQKEAEKYLSEKVANKLNQLLSSESFQFDVNTSKELFSLIGGGICIKGEYIPVQPEKINETLKSFSLPTNIQ